MSIPAGLGPSPEKRGRVWRWTRNILLVAVSLVVLVAIVGACYEALGSRADARRFPEEGKLVDVGGYRLNLNCTGSGNPTVILEDGLGVHSVGWKLVQPEIAKFTRVCSYDRAGYGWSDAGPMPRTSAQIVKELHALLQNAGEKPPYVLVGHSFGGFNVRVYNGQFPDEVGGLVLVDASHEEQNELMPQAIKDWSAKQMKQAKTQQALAPILLRLGFLRFLGRKQTPPPGVPKDLFEEHSYLSRQVKYLEATSAEITSFDESAKEVRAAGTLGDKPLIVLTAGKKLDEKELPPGLPAKDFEDFHKVWVDDLQMREAHLSTQGRRVLVPDSGHMIPFERPGTIVTAVREVCSALNAASALTAH